MLTEVSIPGSYIAVLPGGGTQTQNKPDSWHYYDLRPDRLRKRKPTGWLYPTSYSLETYTRVKPIGTLTTNGIRFTGNLPYVDGNSTVFSHLSLPSGGENRAITRALLKLKDQNVNYGVAIAEAGKTADLVASTATRLARSVQALRRRDYETAFRTLGINPRELRDPIHKDLPSAWLQMQYGWKPLLSDVHGAIQDLCFRSGQAPSWRQTVKGSVQEKDYGRQLDINGSFGSKYVSYKREAGVMVRLDYTPGNTFLSAMSRSGVLNPAEVLWEVVPFSFVVDWFLPVGDYLKTLDADAGWIFLSGSCSSFQRNRSSEAPGPPSGSYTSGNFAGKYYRATMNRKVYSSSPRPGFPGVKNPWSVGHVANGLALLASAFR